ncbi:MAG: rhomboid family intramembrane serine protease [Planctomycetota bacterium]|nr:rhomboid family intramembrane serine protease [Planctomycetota bacterium]
MLIPIRTDYRMTLRPWVNYALVAINVCVFIFVQRAGSEAGGERIYNWLLHPDRPELMQFFSSVFLHGSWMHLIGNMVFLWVFGNALNDRFGHAGYLSFYLAGGVLAGVGYLLLGGHAPVLGASGAISAVTGAYLVLFPRVRLTLLVWFYVVTTFEVSSLYFLLVQFVWNVLMSTENLAGRFGGGGVAYTAHSSGYVFGIIVAAALLVARLLPKDAFDLLSLIRARYRRLSYQRMVARGYDPFSPSRPGEQAAGRRRIKAKTVQTETSDTATAREMELRLEISEACGRHDLPAAADGYLRLVRIADDAVLSRPNQLDVANQLMAAEAHPAAADAYERFIRHYGDYEHLADIFLMLGLLYGRYLHQYDRAEQALQRAVDGLSDPRKVEMAQSELKSLRRRR